MIANLTFAEASSKKLVEFLPGQPPRLHGIYIASTGQICRCYSDLKVGYGKLRKVYYVDSSGLCHGFL